MYLDDSLLEAFGLSEFDLPKERAAEMAKFVRTNRP